MFAGIQLKESQGGSDAVQLQKETKYQLRAKVSVRSHAISGPDQAHNGIPAAEAAEPLGNGGTTHRCLSRGQSSRNGIPDLEN